MEKEKGVIEIKCIMLDSSFQISIKDDGQGIDDKLIGEKAIEEKIITRKEFEKMMPHERINLIFKEGFSSRQEANTISGRGLGMDIISHNTSNLGGKIKIITEKGKGTEFLMTFPFDFYSSN